MKIFNEKEFFFNLINNIYRLSLVYKNCYFNKFEMFFSLQLINIGHYRSMEIIN